MTVVVIAKAGLSFVMTDNHPFAEQLANVKPGGFILCFACRTLGHCRLGMTSEDVLPDGRTLTKIKCPADQQGGPGVAHGGWTASVLDEMFGHLALLQGLFTVTGSLTVEYLRPVPVERDLEGYAWVEKRDDSRWQVRGELRLAANGKLLSRAHGLFIQRDASHFKRHEQWLAEQESK
jgi:acyl-coenzyme A thioesterase PaaI-like protein